MDQRERMIRTVRFQPVDRLPLRHAFGLMPGVLEDWHEAGLPRSVQTYEDVCEHFGFPTRGRGLPADIRLRPGFEAKVLADDDDFRIAVDSLGRTTRLSKKVASIPLPMDFPVKDWDSWADYKRRLEFSPDRVGDGLERVAAENAAAGHLNRLAGHGFYWFPRDLMGDEGLCAAYYEQPDLVKDICETHCRLLEGVLAAELERIRLDEVHFGEDMAYRNASMIGPAIFDEFIRPYYLRIQRLVEQYEVPIFSVDTDGCLDELAGWFCQCGVNLIGPNEVAAGNDICRYRGRFGRKMALEGGLDKRVLTRGRDAIDRMLEGTIPFMKDTGGGWVVSLDHRVVKGTPLADFQHYVDRVGELASF